MPSARWPHYLNYGARTPISLHVSPPGRRHLRLLRRASSRSLTPCCQDAFFPAAGFLFAFHRSGLLPGWYRFLHPERCVPLYRLLVLVFPPKWSYLFQRCRPFSEASLRRGPGVEVRFHPPPKRRMARFPSVASVSSSVSRRSLSWRGFAVPLFVTEVVPKNCYCHSYRRCTVIGTSATRSQPSLFHTSRRLCG
jgi:hypothetical protein